MVEPICLNPLDTFWWTVLVPIKTCGASTFFLVYCSPLRTTGGLW